MRDLQFFDIRGVRTWMLKVLLDQGCWRQRRTYSLCGTEAWTKVGGGNAQYYRSEGRNALRCRQGSGSKHRNMTVSAPQPSALRLDVQIGTASTAMVISESCPQLEERPLDPPAAGISSCPMPLLNLDTLDTPLLAPEPETSSSDPYGDSRPTKATRKPLGPADPCTRVTGSSMPSSRYHRNKGARELGLKAAPRRDSVVQQRGSRHSRPSSGLNVFQLSGSSKCSAVQQTASTVRNRRIETGQIETILTFASVSLKKIETDLLGSWWP
jgi:hypothetical protein